MFGHGVSTDESDATVSDEDASWRRSFRVSVCLRHYFADVRARAFVAVRPARRVRWLEARLRRAFVLRGAFCLRAAGHLLPRAEPLLVLRPDDTVEVIPLEEAEPEIKVPDNTANVRTVEAEEKTASPTSPYLATRAARDGTGTTNGHGDGSGRVGVENSEIPLAAAVDSGADCVDRAADDAALRRVKRRALALLDAACADGAPRRVRRRVRRRVPRAPDRPASPAPHAPHVPGGSPRAHSRDVARNEDACARRPRMVRSLDLDDS